MVMPAAMEITRCMRLRGPVESRRAGPAMFCGLTASNNEIALCQHAPIVAEGGGAGRLREMIAGSGNRIAGANVLGGRKAGVDPSLRQGGRHLACARKPIRSVSLMASEPCWWPAVPQKLYDMRLLLGGKGLRPPIFRWLSRLMGSMNSSELAAALRRRMELKIATVIIPSSLRFLAGQTT